MSDRSHPTPTNVDRRSMLKRTGALLGGLVALGVSNGPLQFAVAQGESQNGTGPAAAAGATGNRVVADPTSLPGPIGRRDPLTHDITLDIVEKVAEIEPGVTFNYMTFGGQVPGPLIRVRQGDTINFTLNNGGVMPHNIDFHAVYGPGGGAEATLVAGGQSNGLTFKAMYPGAFVYHCALAGVLDQHISSGMFGLIVVEPPEGLPPVDREFYFGQHEVYTNRATGEKGHHGFDFPSMWDERPKYVLLNGGKHAITADRYGSVKARVGETVRIFFANGGPNLTSNFHPIGNVWSKAWREGAIASTPERFVQTVAVPPGSSGIFEMELLVPGEITLVDHALSRAGRKGAMAVIEVEGDARPDIFDAEGSATA